MRYDAFISYSHGADARLAPALQRALHRFAKPWWRARAVTVFRDETSLAAAHSLPATLARALDESAFFILMASPAAARSKWVADECEHFARHRDPTRMLIVLSEGEIAWDGAAGDFDWAKTDALPECLKGVFRAEPLYVDLRWARPQLTNDAASFNDRDPRFLAAVARISAALRGMSLEAIAGEELKQHRKTRRIAYAAVSAIALLALGASAGAWIATENAREAGRQRAVAEAERRVAEQRRAEAERQTKIAEARLESAVMAVQILLRDIAFELKNLPGMSAERFRVIMEKAGTILDRLEAVGHTRATRRLRVGVLLYLVDAYRALGEPDKAMAHARLGVRLATALMAEDRTDPLLVLAAATMTERFGDVAGDKGEVDEAIQAYRTAIGLATHTSAQGEAEFARRHDLVVLHNKLGLALHRRGENTDALQVADQCAAASSQLLAGETETQRALVRRLPVLCRELRSIILLASGRAGEALGLLKDIYEERRKLVAPGNDTQALRDLSVAAANYGMALALRSELDRAVAVLSEGKIAAQKLSQIDERNLHWLEDVVQFGVRVGRVLALKRDWDGALASYGEARRGIADLRKRAATRPAWDQQEGQLLLLEGEVHVGKGDYSAARARYLAAVPILRDVARNHPKNLNWQLDYIGAQERVATLSILQQDWPTALAGIRATASDIERLAALAPDWFEAQERLYALHVKLGDVYGRLGQAEESRRHYRRALELAERAALRFPNKPQIATLIAALRRNQSGQAR